MSVNVCVEYLGERGLGLCVLEASVKGLFFFGVKRWVILIGEIMHHVDVDNTNVIFEVLSGCLLILSEMVSKNVKWHREVCVFNNSCTITDLFLVCC